ncbi:MAG: transposase [Chloroflexi bacterium]|nr:transposase [Chloroflexota bacterium]MBU1750003.1 transposase [Chloroflexota bacterium]
MFTYAKVKNKPQLLRAMTSLDRSEFEELVDPFRAAWAVQVRQTALPEADRQRQSGGGRKPVLRTIEDKLLFILYYFKCYPLQEVLGAEFGLSQPRACEWVHLLAPVLKATLATLNVLPEREAARLAVKLSASGETKFGIDGVERRIQRPRNVTKQIEYYSGKKRTHTVKNNVVVTLKSRQVQYLSRTHEGKKHDKKICDEEQPTFPPGCSLYQDTGFQGYAPAGVTTWQPKKKPRGQALSAQDKRRNQRISRVRIIVEHVLAGVKRCRIVKDVLRNTTEGFADRVMEIACGLHNFRTARRRAKRAKQRAAEPYFR